MNSVVSAAIIEGALIIGLSDGTIINCGFVQGPQGLTGPQGPMGATGTNGLDGNTIHTIAGTPSNEMGTDGDYAIDNVNWRIYGPRSGGTWGKAKEILPSAKNFLENGRSPSGGSMGGSSSSSNSAGGTAQTTSTLPLSNPTRLGNARGLPDTSGLKTQADYNQWAFNSLETLAAGVSPDVDLSGYATKEELSTATSSLPYRLETDKVIKTPDQPVKQNAFDDHINSAHTGGEIQLVDNEGYFHNVRFSGQHGIETRSDQQGIIVDGTALLDRIKTLESQVETLVTLVPPVDYGTCTVKGGNDWSNGQCWLPQNETGAFICELSGSQTHGCRYKWEIIRGAARISGSDSMSAVTMSCTDPAPNTVVLRCTVTHPTTNAAVHGEVQILVQNLD